MAAPRGSIYRIDVDPSGRLTTLATRSNDTGTTWHPTQVTNERTATRQDSPSVHHGFVSQPEYDAVEGSSLNTTLRPREQSIPSANVPTLPPLSDNHPTRQQQHRNTLVPSLTIRDGTEVQHCNQPCTIDVRTVHTTPAPPVSTHLTNSCVPSFSTNVQHQSAMRPTHIDSNGRENEHPFRTLQRQRERRVRFQEEESQRRTDNQTNEPTDANVQNGNNTILNNPTDSQRGNSDEQETNSVRNTDPIAGSPSNPPTNDMIMSTQRQPASRENLDSTQDDGRGLESDEEGGHRNNSQRGGLIGTEKRKRGRPVSRGGTQSRQRRRLNTIPTNSDQHLLTSHATELHDERFMQTLSRNVVALEQLVTLLTESVRNSAAQAMATIQSVSSLGDHLVKALENAEVRIVTAVGEKQRNMESKGSDVCKLLKDA